MRVSLSWLQDLVQVNEPADQLGERLSMAGFEVEEMEDLSLLAQGVVVGEVVACDRHPNADKLSVCKVDVGNGQTLQICLWGQERARGNSCSRGHGGCSSSCR